MVLNFNQFMNESMGLQVEEPYDEKMEHSALSKFKIDVKPITVTDCDGNISESLTDVWIVFSNGDKLEYSYRWNKGYSAKIIKYGNQKNIIDVSEYVEDYLGSTQTLMGDICLLYKDFYIGKIY